MSSAVRTIGGLSVALGVLWVAAGIGVAYAFSLAIDESDDPEERDFFRMMRSGFLWTLLPLGLAYIAAGGGLIAGQAWGRAAALALVPWTFLVPPILGTALAIATFVILTGRDADVWLGQARSPA